MLLSFFFPSECLEAPACELTDAVLTPPGAASRVLWSTSEAWQATADRQGLGWTAIYASYYQHLFPHSPPFQSLLITLHVTSISMILFLF